MAFSYETYFSYEPSPMMLTFILCILLWSLMGHWYEMAFFVYYILPRKKIKYLTNFFILFERAGLDVAAVAALCML